MPRFVLPETRPATSASLVGIARLAAQSPQVHGKRDVEYFSLASKSILNRCSSSRMPFTWTINPYRGCEFGCKYCYARYTHEFMGMEDSAQFEEKIYSKDRADEILKKELGKQPGGAIAVGTATDPYQPAERHFETTRKILQTISRFRGLQVSITTKSDLIRRDLKLLLEIALYNDVRVNMTVTTMRAGLARCLEVRAPRPDLRLQAVAELAHAGIPTAVFAMPVLPGITDRTRDLEDVARAASRAGACYFAINVLFLMPSAQKAFFPFLEVQFPHLVERYRRIYASSAYLRGEYPAKIELLASELRGKYNLTDRQHGHPAALMASPQMELFAEKRC